MRENRVLDVDGHIDRMVASSGWPRTAFLPLYENLLRAAAASPGWSFPLVTLREGQLTYKLRPLSPDALRTTVTVWTPEEPDSRRVPWHKGPEFPLQTSLQRQAKSHGAEEALMIGADGILREGAYSSVVHWVDGALVVSSAPQRLPSVTESAVVRAAISSGYPVMRRPCGPREVRAADEVWTLSSLHGIRVVTAWDGEPVSEAGIAAEFREHLQTFEQDVAMWLVASPSTASPEQREAREYKDGK
ncbi:aminotransferase class IV [Nocardiopsis kunsanensis]|uniref:aminotransferase class IV n=1 Tax=Nocardiopsis kunsanensis TaxID=141693 RepID=UPI000346D480|nr:aminotransferase class IV [Nocardiopsis kunsanensis]